MKNRLIINRKELRKLGSPEADENTWVMSGVTQSNEDAIIWTFRGESNDIPEPSFVDYQLKSKIEGFEEIVFLALYNLGKFDMKQIATMPSDLLNLFRQGWINKVSG